MCQSDVQGDLIDELQNEINILKASLSEKPEFGIQMLKDNNKLTRFYTGLPTYNIFLVLVDYLKPIVKVMRSWKGSSTNSIMVCSALVLQINFFLSLFDFDLVSLSQMSAQDSKFLKQHTAACSLHGNVYCQRCSVKCSHFLLVSKCLNGCREGLRNIFPTQELL